MWISETTHLFVDDEGWVRRKPDPADDDGDYEFCGSIDDPDCVTDDLADEYDALCDAWRRDVGALQVDRDEHMERRYAR